MVELQPSPRQAKLPRHVASHSVHRRGVSFPLLRHVPQRFGGVPDEPRVALQRRKKSGKWMEMDAVIQGICEARFCFSLF